MTRDERALLAERLQSEESDNSGVEPDCFVGFDGFNDRICQAVDQRDSPGHYTPITTIEAFGKRIIAASGKSTNIELVQKRLKVGGNAPILTSALLELGHRVVFAGGIGNGTPSPLFTKMASRCIRTYCLCESGETDAIEFSDGKVLLGKIVPITQLTMKDTLEKIGSDTLEREIRQAKLVATVNWTMMPMMTDFWNYLADHPSHPRSLKNPPWFFVDLADPCKRTDNDIIKGLEAIKRLTGAYRTVLGLNISESERLAALFHLPLCSNTHDEVLKRAEAIKAKTGLTRVVIHATKFACGADENNLECVEGAYDPHPLITTGAGDHFNAGYCHGLLHHYSMRESLLCGSALSGYYVRSGTSPSKTLLAAFLIGLCPNPPKDLRPLETRFSG